ncbi:MAG: hypothetical protein U1E97_09470 [Alphaproteobacteria bacterium]
MLTSVMGVGGASAGAGDTHVLGMPTVVAIGTSPFQIVRGGAGDLSAGRHQSECRCRPAILLVGGVIGAQFEPRLGSRLGALHLRGLLALLVIAVAARLAVDLVVEPADLFTLTNMSLM